MQRRLLVFGILVVPILVLMATRWRSRPVPADPLAEAREKVGTRAASPLLERLRLDHSSQADVFLLSARQARLEGNVKDAGLYLEQADALCSPTPALERERSLQRAAARPHQAQAILGPFLAANPDDEILLTLAEAELQLGHHERAVETAECVLQRSPRDARAMYLRGRGHLLARRLAPARVDLECAVAAGRDSLVFTPARIELATCLLDLGEFALSLELFQALRHDEPTNLRALFGVGRAASYLGRTEESEQAFLSVLAIRPGHTETLLALAQVVEQRGELTRALAYLEQAEAGDPNRLETLARLAKLLGAIGQPGRADDYEKRYRALDPTRTVPGVKK